MSDLQPSKEIGGEKLDNTSSSNDSAKSEDNRDHGNSQIVVGKERLKRRYSWPSIPCHPEGEADDEPPVYVAGGLLKVPHTDIQTIDTTTTSSSDNGGAASNLRRRKKKKKLTRSKSERIIFSRKRKESTGSDSTGNINVGNISNSDQGAYKLNLPKYIFTVPQPEFKHKDKPWKKKKSHKNVKISMAIQPDICDERKEHKTKLDVTIDLAKKDSKCSYTALVKASLHDPVQGCGGTTIVPFICEFPPDKRSVRFFVDLMSQDEVGRCINRKLRLEVEVTILIDYEQYSDEDYEIINKQA